MATREEILGLAGQNAPTPVGGATAPVQGAAQGLDQIINSNPSTLQGVNDDMDLIATYLQSILVGMDALKQAVEIIMQEHTQLMGGGQQQGIPPQGQPQGLPQGQPPVEPQGLPPEPIIGQ